MAARKVASLIEAGARPVVIRPATLRRGGLTIRISTGGSRGGRAGLPDEVGTMFCICSAPDPVTETASAKTRDTTAFGRFFQAMLEAGVYLAPLQFEAGFTRIAHTTDGIDATVEAARRAFRAV